MLRLRSLCAAMLLLVLLTACDPFEDQSSSVDGTAPSTAATPVAAGVDSTDRIALGADTLVRGMALLNERYDGGADGARLLAAGQRGAWAAVAQSGIPPRDVDAPPEAAAQTDSLQGFRTRYLRTAQK